jgi:hypothetical protein
VAPTLLPVGNSDTEPTSLKQALYAHDAQEWRSAIQREFNSLVSNGTFDDTALSPDILSTINPLTCKWVSRKKSNANGPPIYKARIIIRGFEQTQGIDFDETYAPVSKSTMLRLLFGKAALYNWPSMHMDVQTKFLNPRVDRDNLYIMLPGGLQDFTSAHVVWLGKALYRLKQSPRLWYEDINATQLSVDLQPSNKDMNLYIGQGVFILLYIDDILLTKQVATMHTQKWYKHD